MSAAPAKNQTHVRLRPGRRAPRPARRKTRWTTEAEDREGDGGGCDEVQRERRRRRSEPLALHNNTYHRVSSRVEVGCGSRVANRS
jgi:hypothetical protein